MQPKLFSCSYFDAWNPWSRNCSLLGTLDCVPLICHGGTSFNNFDCHLSLTLQVWHMERTVISSFSCHILFQGDCFSVEWLSTPFHWAPGHLTDWFQSSLQESNRINIAPNNNTADITGGFIGTFKHGQNQKNGNTINGTTPNTTNNQWNVVYPAIDSITPAQLKYFQE